LALVDDHKSIQPQALDGVDGVAGAAGAKHRRSGQ
jgi:hypothetical protein